MNFSVIKHVGIFLYNHPYMGYQSNSMKMNVIVTQLIANPGYHLAHPQEWWDSNHGHFISQLGFMLKLLALFTSLSKKDYK